MEYEGVEFGLVVSGEESEKLVDCLSESELERLCFFAEHPELADPVIWFLPEKKAR